jgi:sigma-54 dependent transcriptional regulator, acetoin dehydrogenase operon transcriptional activator AcoR
VRGANSGPHADLVHSIVGHSMAAPATGARLAPTVDISWRRCLNDFKLDPIREYQPHVLDRSRIKDLQSEFEELVQIARAEMDSLYEQISGSGYALLLADTQGVILCEKVDPTLKKTFLGAGLIVGAQWSERCEGTNGIGTCAAEARPITIHQADHFRSRHIRLSCSAAPIHDPRGDIIAVLDASCVNAEGSRESQLHTVALVNSSARLIEKCLFLRRYRSDTMLRFHHRPEFVDLLHDGAIAVAADGSIVASDVTGLKLLGAEHREDLVGRSIADIFDTTYEELLATARAGRRAMWELRDHRYGRRYFASLVQADRQGSRVSIRSSTSPQPMLRVAHDPAPAQLSLTDVAGDDPQMLRNLRNAQRVADSTVTVLVHGPTGSGKEAFARALHRISQRADRPFVAVNCAAIPESLIESELFGYVSGAFTGARREGMRGRIVQASGGTLFLDEIGDMPLLMQTRLLRVLEDHEVTPLGSEAAINVDLRVICASHRDLRDMLAHNQFREDLYYRLNGITLELPSLAKRRDLESLIRKCIANESAEHETISIEVAALQLLLAHDWPGNIRELRNAIRSALAICEQRTIRVGDLPEDVRRRLGTVPSSVGGNNPACAPPSAISAPWASPSAAVTVAAASFGEGASLQTAERDVLIRAIEEQHGHMTAVAAQLRISRNTLYRKIKRHGIQIGRRPENR